MDAAPASAPQARFGTFTGVFTPTLLTILGVIMYIRLGWVVGNGGLLGAWLIMGLALAITAATGLSLSSIASNTRLGAGGPYAIISNALGFEVGGAIGLPLYLSRPLGVAMYVIGFREGWQWIFPDHPALIIDLVVFLLLFGIAYRSATLAFNIQYVIMAVIAASIVSVLASPETLNPSAEIVWWGDFVGFPEDGFQGASIYVVFAVFFPATTGIFAGANMSGELKDPRRAIPVGALSAIVVASAIYFVLAWWIVGAGTPEELTSNYTIMIDKARWPAVVLAGLLGATASSALTGLVGGPRILLAMGEHRLLPRSGWVARCDADGEPRNAMAVTGLLTLACLMVRDLNALAALVTMFFLITYGMLNVVVLIEQSLGLVSFRPSLRIPFWVPLMGVLGSLFAMIVVNPLFGVIATTMVLAVYAWLMRRGLEATGKDVRSGVFVALAEWAAARAQSMRGQSVRAWKPSLLVPVEDPEQIRGEFQLLLDICRPEGNVKLLGVADRDALPALKARVGDLAASFSEDEVFCISTAVAAPEFSLGVTAGLQALQSAFFRPNILFLTAPGVANRNEEFADVILQARDTGVGVLLLGLHRKAGLGRKNLVRVYLRAKGTWSVDRAFETGNLNLLLLLGYRLLRTWDADLEIVTVLRDDTQVEAARRFLKSLCDAARIPPVARRRVLVGDFAEVVAAEEPADLNLMGLQPRPDLDFVERMVELTRGSCLLVMDSGRESALA